MVSRKNDKYIKGRRGKLITLLIASFVLLLSVGYTALNEELTISGEASFRVEEDIRVTGINLIQTTNSSIEDYNPTYGKDSIKVGVTLPSNQSTVTYKVKIANYSNVAMKIAKIEKLVTNNNYTITFNKTLPLTIGKLSEEEIEITFKNNTNISQIIESTLQFTFEKLEAMMTTGNANASTSTFYNGPITKDSVESITFMSTKEIPEDAVGYWDCSYAQGKNEVIAYYLNSDTEGMYDLYIAADGEVYAPDSSNNLFRNFNKVVSINFNNSFNTSKVTNMGAMFSNCVSLESLDLSKFDTSKLTSVGYGWNGGMFFGCSKLTELDLTNFNTSKVTRMGDLFYGCSSLTALDLSSFNTSKVTDMSYMFASCKNLSNVNLSSFNTSNVTNMGSMFYGCNALNTLDLSNFNTKKVTTMIYMFRECDSLTRVNLSSFDTTEVKSMSYMFTNCKSLISLDLNNFNTSNVTNMSYMFAECKNLSNVNISSFDLTNTTNMSFMFYNCKALMSLDIRNMDFENKTITTTSIFGAVPSGVNIYVLNEYNKNYIESLKSNANVIIYTPFDEKVEEG